jgi:predicted phage tail protein
MTNIYIKGLLGKIFGNFFRFKVNDFISAIKAIEANKVGFLNKMVNLSKEGYNYEFIIDGCKVDSMDFLIEKKTIKNIYIVPIINGSGPIIVQAIIMAVVQAVIQLTLTLIMAAIAKSATPPLPPVRALATGGSVGAARAVSKSYIFSNYQNKANQGSPIVVGYGKMRIGSQIISMQVANYPSNLTFFQKVSYRKNFELLF